MSNRVLLLLRKQRYELLLKMLGRNTNARRTTRRTKDAKEEDEEEKEDENQRRDMSYIACETYTNRRRPVEKKKKRMAL